MSRRIRLYLGILLLCIISSSCQNSDLLEPDSGRKEETVELSENRKGEMGNIDKELEIYSIKLDHTQTEQGGEEVSVETLYNDSLKLSELISSGSDIDMVRSKLREYSSGTALDLTDMEEHTLKDLFYSMKIDDDIKERIVGKTYGKDCDVPFSELRYIRVLYYGFDGRTHIGELIVARTIADDILEIFQELYGIDYPIERMVLADEYEADDNLSMAANNSSAFNYRKIEGSDRISLHSYGLAIDINPHYNPYVHQLDGGTVITPKNGEKYADRSLDCEYYIRSEDPCYNAFIKRGFTWGGDWTSLKDYQHFQKD